MAYTNLDYLKEITDGDKQIIRELIDLFLLQVPDFIINLNKYYNSGEYILLGKEAHKAKSSLQIMGMSELEKEMKTLQLRTIDGTDIENYPVYIRHFEEQCRVAVIELKAELEKL
jgi:HPt (histidine-containing phosphotransfer) domain-containing protein